MIKILYFIDSLSVGGVESSILTTALHLKQVSVSVCVLNVSEIGDLKESYIQAGIKLYMLENDYKPYWIIKARKAFMQLVKELQPDIVHVSLYSCNLVARISVLPSQTKLIGSFVNDDYCALRYKSQAKIRNKELNGKKYLERLTINANDSIISNTRAIAISNTTILHYPIDKVKVIYRGRNTEIFKYHERNLSDSDRFVFLSVGRLNLQKGYVYLLYAVAKLKQKSTQRSFKVMIAGRDNEHGKALEALVEKMGLQHEVEFLGNRNDIPSLLAQYHCFVIPSIYEGIGGAAIEAMFAGIPIISSDIDVFKEVLREDFTAKMFQVTNSTDLAEKMQWAMDNYEQAKLLAKNARAVAEEKFDMVNIARQLEDYYSEVYHSNKSSTFGKTKKYFALLSILCYYFLLPQMYRIESYKRKIETLMRRSKSFIRNIRKSVDSQKAKNRVFTRLK
jgi:glycosyltransferase involved in cell wall biosynthesis